MLNGVQTVHKQRNTKHSKGKNSIELLVEKIILEKKNLNCAESFDWVKIGEKNGRISGNQW